jgi:hypothetical protein
LGSRPKKNDGEPDDDQGKKQGGKKELAFQPK